MAASDWDDDDYEDDDTWRQRFQELFRLVSTAVGGFLVITLGFAALDWLWEFLRYAWPWADTAIR